MRVSKPSITSKGRPRRGRPLPAPPGREASASRPRAAAIPDRGRGRTARGRVGSYGRFVWFLVKDGLWRFKGRTALVLATGYVAVSLQGSALALALQYGRWLENDSTVSYFGRTWEARSSLELLWIFTAAVAVLLVVSAALIYASRAATIKLMGKYETMCSTRALDLFARVRRVVTEPSERIASDGTITRIVRVDSREAALVVLMLVEGIVSAVTLLGVFGVLFVLRPWLTLILLVVIGLSGAFVYRTNRRGADTSRELEVSAGAASNQYRQVIRWIRGTAFSRPRDPDWVKTSVVGAEDTKRNYEAYQRRWQVVEEAKLVSNLVAAVSFFVILGVFGTQIITSGTGFGVMAVYLVALRKGTTSFREVNQRLSSITRHYPQVKRYISFVEASEDLGAGDEDVLSPPALDVRVVRGLDGSLRSSDLRAVNVAGLLAPVGVNLYSMAAIVDSLFGGQNDGRAQYLLRRSVFVTADYEMLPRRPFRETVGIPPDWDRASVVGELTASGFTPEDAEAVPDLDDPVDDRGWRQVTERLRFAFAALAARRSSAEWLFFDEGGLSGLTEEQRTSVLGPLEDRVNVVVYDHRHSDPGAYGEEIVAVIDGERLIGLGPVEWYLGQREAAEARLRQGPFAEVTRIGRGLDDEQDMEIESEDLL